MIDSQTLSVGIAVLNSGSAKMKEVAFINSVGPDEVDKLIQKIPFILNGTPRLYII